MSIGFSMATEILTARFHDMKKFVSYGFFVENSVVKVKFFDRLLRSVECEGGLSSTKIIGTKGGLTIWL